MALISPSRRLRRTPFSDGVEAAGVKAYTVYNRMLLPTVFRSVEEDYAHLKSAVQVWDVAVERQVVNDPVAVKLAEDRWWISIADSDLLLWVKGIANGYRLDVLVDEPDVSPLAVQGPKADDLMARVFGDAVRDIRFFRFGLFEFQGRSLVVARSGYSKQGGFEIYVEGGDIGMPLWHALMAIGCIGRDALLRVAKDGPVQQIRAIEIAGGPVPPCDRAWPLMEGNEQVGQVTSAAWVVLPDEIRSAQVWETFWT